MLKKLLRRWLELPAIEESLQDCLDTQLDVLEALTHLPALHSQQKALEAAVQDHTGQIADIVSGILEGARQAELARSGQTECAGCGRTVPSHSATGGKCHACSRR